MKGRISNSFRHACLQLARSAECKAEKEKKQLSVARHGMRNGHDFFGDFWVLPFYEATLSPFRRTLSKVGCSVLRIRDIKIESDYAPVVLKCPTT